MNSKQSIFFLILITVASCAEHKDTRYRDTTELEIPPTIEIVEKPEAQVQASNKPEQTVLANKILLAGSELVPVIKIKKLFDRSWNLVEQALKLNDIQVKDKNRELGVFYILFSSEQQKPDEAQTFDTITSFFFSDDTRKSGYKLTVAWQESDTEVAAEIVAEDDGDGLLDDEDEDIEDFASTVDNSAALINTLYQTLKHDLEIN